MTKVASGGRNQRGTVRVAVAGGIGRGRVEVVGLVAAKDLAVQVVGQGHGPWPAAADADRVQLPRGAVGEIGVIGRLVGLDEARARLGRPVPPGEAVGGGATIREGGNPD